MREHWRFGRKHWSLLLAGLAGRRLDLKLAQAFLDKSGKAKDSGGKVVRLKWLFHRNVMVARQLYSNLGISMTIIFVFDPRLKARRNSKEHVAMERLRL